jgi:cation diffusion facilitator family transporter
MPRASVEKWKVSHDFVVDDKTGEKRSLIVLWLTALTMVVEIVAGTIFGSMALLADGWHMMTHVAAFAITLFAYSFARKHKDDPDYSFSTGKVGVLGGFASAVALGTVALMMVMESLERFFNPEEIQFDQAIIVAVVGLLVNGASVFLLHDHHDHHGHGHHHDHDHDEHHHHHDLNLMAAYFHVLADALTSILAIVSLLIGKWLGWQWPDPAMGIVGALVIMKWAAGLMKQSSRILLDGSANAAQRTAVKEAIESDGDAMVSDLHIWKVSPQHAVLLLSVVAHKPCSPQVYKERLAEVGSFAHVSVEVNPCDDPQ